MTEYIIKLQDAEKLGIEEVGAKSFNLSRLMNSGFNVPDGYVVTTESQKFLSDNGSLPFSFLGLENRKYAVRSSANVEDSKKASFAGCFHTSLNVLVDQVGKEILKCFESSKSKKVSKYTQLKNIKRPIKMAVLIQEMIEPTAAGVIFTKSIHDYNLFSIEAVLGLADEYVSGNETADIYLVDRKTGELKKKHPLHFRNRFVLTDENIKKLFSTGMRIENLFGYPQDIEYALKDSETFILQTRPITTLR